MYESAIPRFAKVTAVATLDYLDQEPVDEATTQLARAKAALAE